MQAAVPGLFMMPPQMLQQQMQVGGDETVEDKTLELILMTGSKGPRRWRQRKTDYLHSLEQDNAQLKSLIVENQQQISALQAQNDILRDQLSYFQGCLAQAGPMVFQQTQQLPNQQPTDNNVPPAVTPKST